MFGRITFASPRSWRLVAGALAAPIVLGAFAGPAAATVGETSRMSVSSGQDQADGASEDAAVSADGRIVAFSSSASNLVAGDTNYARDIFVQQHG
jgi:hypothetical protein